MKLNRALLCVGTCLSAVAAVPVSAATIEVVSGTRGATIAAFDPIGQSFTAVDTGISSFGFQFQGLNTSQPNSALTFTLYAGEGTGGTALATTSFTVPDAAVSTRTPTWYDINLSSFGLNLTPGQLYTGSLIATSTRAAVAHPSGTSPAAACSASLTTTASISFSASRFFNSYASNGVAAA